MLVTHVGPIDSLTTLYRGENIVSGSESLRQAIHTPALVGLSARPTLTVGRSPNCCSTSMDTPTMPVVSRIRETFRC